MKKLLFTGILFSTLLVPSIVYSQQYPNEGMPIRDLEGNEYRVIMTQSGVWMAENLKTFSLNDGTKLTYARDKNGWKDMKKPAYGFFNPDVKYSETYGAIYNWHAVATGKLCPKGWHVPTEAEWNDLMDYGDGNERSGENPAKLKEAGTKHWKQPNTGATNETHFTALPAGYINLFMDDYEPGTKTLWWTATEDKMNLEPGEKPTNAAVIGLSYDFHSKTAGTYSKEAALPVRCKMND
jgi:uncharacterized protein (TIGR02145 family)